MIALGCDQAHVWYAFPDRIADAALVARYQALLNAEERTRHDRLAMARPRREHLVTRALCRTTLSRYADVAPQQWQFTCNPHGRPEISGPPETPPLRFNLSHCAGLIACVVTCAVDAGIDVEDLDRPGETVRVADRYFSPQEVADLRALPPAQQRVRFFEYWTLKESYIKARGLGLAIPLDQFTFHLAPGRPVTISFGPRIADDPRLWQFRRYRPSARHLMAVAIRRGHGADLAVDLRETVPLR
ncbi:MAG: 4'-phosphopantetheinyl transferase superfamily protein [Candidatus Binatia bacterium]